MKIKWKNQTENPGDGSPKEAPASHWYNPLKVNQAKKFRNFRMKRFRSRPHRDFNILHLLPNVLTSGNAACGAASIIYCVEGQYTVAAVLIIMAAFFDMIDGKAARLLGTSSPFGVQLDSLADAISFGVAPPILIRAISYHGYHRLGLSLVLVYTLCTVLRLARYNVQATENTNKKREYFTGLPCPVPAVFLAAVVLVADDYGIPLSDPFIRSTLHIVVVILACLMVSTIPYPDLSAFKIERKNVYQHNVILSLVLCVIVLLGKLFFLVAPGLFILAGLALALYHLKYKVNAESSEEATGRQTTPVEEEHHPASIE